MAISKNMYWQHPPFQTRYFKNFYLKKISQWIILLLRLTMNGGLNRDACWKHLQKHAGRRRLGVIYFPAATNDRRKIIRHRRRIIVHASLPFCFVWKQGRILCSMQQTNTSAFWTVVAANSRNDACKLQNRNILIQSLNGKLAQLYRRHRIRILT